MLKNSPQETGNPIIQKNSIYVWNGYLLFSRRGLTTEFHAHYAASIVITLDDPFVIETDKIRQSYSAALITSNAYHRTIAAENGKLIVILIDPETFEYESIMSGGTADSIIELDYKNFIHLKEPLSRVYDGISCDDAWKLFEEVLIIFNNSISYKHKIKRDKRVEKIAEILKTELPESIRIDDLSRAVSISGDRIIRLFKEQMGIPLRRYLLWTRLVRAGILLKNGHTLTSAAHDAGFSDSAHMSRTFKENFGFTPSFFFGKKRNIDFHFCDEIISL